MFKKVRAVTRSGIRPQTLDYIQRTRSDGNFAIVQHFRVDATAPPVAHDRSQPADNFVHPLARTCFAGNPQTAGADEQCTPARVGQVET